MSKRAGENVAVPFAPGMGMPVAGTAAPEAATADETSGAVEEEHTLLPRSSEHFTPHLHRKLKLS